MAKQDFARGQILSRRTDFQSPESASMFLVTSMISMRITSATPSSSAAEEHKRPPAPGIGLWCDEVYLLRAGHAALLVDVAARIGGLDKTSQQGGQFETALGDSISMLGVPMREPSATRINELSA